MKEHSEKGESGNLSPELAEQNPELFKEELINYLQGNSYLSYKFYEKFAKEGKIRQVNIDTKSELSRSEKGGVIVIGSILWPENFKETVIFEDENFQDYSLEKTYILSHEIAHRTAFEISAVEKDEKFNNLYTSIINLRKNKSKGFSGLGSLDFYKTKKGKKTGPERQATEDIVELTNMYAWDPEYLKRFLSFLSDSHFKERREELRLCTITKESGKYIFDIISESVEQLVAENKENGGH